MRTVSPGAPVTDFLTGPVTVTVAVEKDTSAGTGGVAGVGATGGLGGAGGGAATFAIGSASRTTTGAGAAAFRTSISIEALHASTVTRISAVPGSIARSSPDSDTATISGREDSH